MISGPLVISSNYKYFLGITLLSALVNEDFNNYYDWKNYQIRYDVIRGRIISLKKELLYSKKFVDILESMLERDEFVRIGVSKLSQIVGVNFYNERYTHEEEKFENMNKGKIGGGDFMKNLKKVKIFFVNNLKRGMQDILC